jgi:hypothetical protein
VKKPQKHAPTHLINSSLDDNEKNDKKENATASQTKQTLEPKTSPLPLQIAAESV